HTHDSSGKPPLIITTVSGGGSRAAYWTFRTLQYLDSLTEEKIFKNTVLLTGASGGMIGAAYWHGLHTEHLKKPDFPLYSRHYLENIGKDLLNAIIFSFASVDFIAPFNKIAIAGKSYSKDRGYAMEQELIRNTEGILDKKIGDDEAWIAQGKIPNIIINSTIVNDGRKLMISSQPVSYLTQPEYALKDSLPRPIDAIDFTSFFKAQHAEQLRLSTALRMNATFPYILPVVKLPTKPAIDIMDAGLRDNFGIEVVARYLNVHKEWIKEHVGKVIVLEIRDTREY